MTTASAPTAAALHNPRAASGVDSTSQSPERSISGSGRATDSPSERKAIAGGSRTERAVQSSDVLAPAWASGAQLIDASFDSAGVVASSQAESADPEQPHAAFDESGMSDQVTMIEQASDADHRLAEVSDVIEFNAGQGVLDPALQRSLRVEFAQAPSTTASDATASGGILSIPPYQLVVGGLALGLAVGGGAGGGGGSGGAGGGSAGGGKPAVKKTVFFGQVELDPVKAKLQFSDVAEEVLMLFTSKPGVKVKVSLEIQAEASTGFDESTQRAARENCNHLKFKNHGFDE